MLVMDGDAYRLLGNYLLAKMYMSYIIQVMYPIFHVATLCYDQ